jgi:hypothetical protein
LLDSSFSSQKLSKGAELAGLILHSGAFTYGDCTNGSTTTLVYASATPQNIHLLDAAVGAAFVRLFNDTKIVTCGGNRLLAKPTRTFCPEFHQLSKCRTAGTPQAKTDERPGDSRHGS